jgi:hypothetical protein
LGSVWVCGVWVCFGCGTLTLCEFVLGLFGFHNRSRLGIIMSFKFILISLMMILLQIVKSNWYGDSAARHCGFHVLAMRVSYVFLCIHSNNVGKDLFKVGNQVFHR